jgi:hypothetical protein
MNERRNVPEIVIGMRELLRRSQTRIDLLFTMSKIPHARPVKDNASEVMFPRTNYLRGFDPSRRSSIPSGGARRDRTDDLMLAKHALSQLSYGPVPEDECLTSAIETHLGKEKTHSIKVVGLGRLELPTSRLSSARSNQLSYKPLTLSLNTRTGNLLARIGASAGCIAQAQAPGACSSAKKEKRRRRNPANGAQQS